MKGKDKGLRRSGIQTVWILEVGTNGQSFQIQAAGMNERWAPSSPCNTASQEQIFKARKIAQDPFTDPQLGQDMLLIEPTKLKLIRKSRENGEVGDLRRGEIDSGQARTRYSYHASFQRPKDPSTSEQLGEQNSACNGARTVIGAAPTNYRETKIF